MRRAPVIRHCAAFACETATTRGLPMCHTHWTALPLPLRRRLAAAARAWPYDAAAHEAALRSAILLLAQNAGIAASDVVFAPQAPARRPRPEGLQMDLFPGARGS